MSDIELDPTLLADFIVESKELLEEFSANLIELEKRPEDPDIIGAAFRAAHTLKGSSAFFNLVHIKNFAHKLENLLDEVRNKTRRVSAEVIDLLLTGGQHLRNMFIRLDGGDLGIDFRPGEEEFLNGLLAFMAAKPKALTVEETLVAVEALIRAHRLSPGDPDLILQEIETMLAVITADSDLETSPATEPASQTAEVRYVAGGVDLTETIQPALAIMQKAVDSKSIDPIYDQILSTLATKARDANLTTLLEPLASAAEDYRAIRDSGLDFDDLLIGMMKNKLDAVVALVEKKIAAPPASLPAPTTTRAKDISPKPEEKTTAAPAENAPPVEPAAVRTPREDRHERKTMRIDEEKVDGFMHYVGELIVTAETFNYLQRLIAHEKVNPLTIRAFKNANQAFRELSDDLQESLMEIRRVPIKGLLQKANMMARELAHQMNKKVAVQIEGQDVQVDKSIAESLEGPLVHVIRNSLDHGLEATEARLAAGKPEEGLLRVMATADKEFFHLEVADDGKGIDPRFIRETAVKKGMMTQIQVGNLSDKEAIALVFAPGFSTAKEITDVSGRGVGMDVVRNNINQLNGSINVDSVVGLGTTITLKIPLSVTLQVVKALLVRVGRENFIISLDDIVESLRPAREELATVEGRGEVIIRRGQIFPLVRLYQVFDIVPDHSDATAAILVVVQTPKGRFGFLVDEVLGQQQVVVKELEAQFKKLDFLSGSAILGDGRLGLVLNIEGVVRLAHGDAK